MCLLKVYSNIDSFESFSKITNIPVFSYGNKGEQKINSNKILDDYRISFDVSGKEWDNFDVQINDAILFLEKYKEQIQYLIATHSITNAYLDFPLWSRLDGNIVNQNDHIPRELIKIAGELNIGIEIAIYAQDAFEDDKDS